MFFLDHLLEHGLISQSCHADLSRWSRHSRIPFGMLAVHHGLLTGEDIDSILDAQRSSFKLFGELAVEMGLLHGGLVPVLLEIQAFQRTCSAAQGVALSGAMSLPAVLAELGDLMATSSEGILEQSCKAVGH